MDSGSGRVELVRDGRVVLAFEVMEIFPLDTIFKERYWTEFKLIPFRTRVMDESLLSPSVS